MNLKLGLGDLFNKILCGDTLTILQKMPDDCIDTIITSPPYWGLRDYGVAGQIGLEKTLTEYINKLLAITGELKRVLKPTGVMFWNHGDCYGGNRAKATPTKTGVVGNQKKDLCAKFNKNIQEKSLALQNYRLILRMIDEQGWILRNTIIWHKPNHMPSSVKDRFANSYEPVFMLTKNKSYWFDLDAVRAPHEYDGRKDTTLKPSQKYSGRNISLNQPQQMARKPMERWPNPSGKNPGDLWTIPTQPFPQAHFATFPERLIEPMIKSSCPAQICKKCGEARVRITKTVYKEAGKGNRNLKRKGGIDTTGSARPYETRMLANTQTLGWTSCKCNADFRPGIVLDPFMGAGTTGLVAQKQGRNYLGIELNPAYIKIADKRLAQERFKI